MVAVVEQKLNDIARLCQSYHVRRLELFGSATQANRFDPQRSDLDFLVEFEPDFDLGPWLKYYFAFREALEQTFGRPVDVVLHSALKNPHFIDSYNRTRTLLYAA